MNLNTEISSQSGINILALIKFVVNRTLWGLVILITILGTISFKNLFLNKSFFDTVTRVTYSAGSYK